MVAAMSADTLCDACGTVYEKNSIGARERLPMLQEDAPATF
jgi:hypothetical protein